MATVSMNKIRLVALKSQRNLILNTLTRSNCFEIASTASLGVGEKVKDISHIEKLEVRKARVTFAIDYLNSIDNEIVKNLKNEHKLNKTKKNSANNYDYNPQKKSFSRNIIGYDDFYDIAAKEYDLLNISDELQKNSFERVELRSKITKLSSFNKNLEPYRNVEMKFSEFKDSGSVTVMLALGLASDKNPLEGLDVIVEDFSYKNYNVLAIVSAKENKRKIIDALTLAGFVTSQFDYDNTAINMIMANEKEIESLNEILDNKLKTAYSYIRYLGEFKVLYDVLNIEIEKSTAELDFIKTNSTFVIEGWAPKSAAEILLDEIKAQTEKVVCYIYEPNEEDTPPTLIHNKQPVKSFEDITNMYSTPKYGELDPNPVMSIFFFVFFGIMLGDAGYGILLTLVCLLAVKLIRFETTTKNLLFMFGICGVSAIIWGIVFGSVFGIPNIPALWFNPLEEPITLFIFSIALGVVQLSAGYLMNMAKKFRDGKILDGLLDNIFILLIFAALVFLVLGMFVAPEIKILTTLAIILFITALAGILLTGGRHAKNIGGKVAGGLSGIYGLINLFSDTLSYCRIFGLGLATGAIASAFNTFGVMLFELPIIGYVLGAVVLVALHSFNMALGILSSYVHNIRLQYLEFYGKFYEGDARPFAPLGSKTKYVRFS